MSNTRKLADEVLGINRFLEGAFEGAYGLAEAWNQVFGPSSGPVFGNTRDPEFVATYNQNADITAQAVKTFASLMGLAHAYTVVSKGYYGGFEDNLFGPIMPMDVYTGMLSEIESAGQRIVRDTYERYYQDISAFA